MILPFGGPDELSFGQQNLTCQASYLIHLGVNIKLPKNGDNKCSKITPFFFIFGSSNQTRFYLRGALYEARLKTIIHSF
ncbi:hypothetical protein GIB67_026374 [Kingdonia uniflora]|uniref:Uncharacterized protein n=1 Tax=Kingdonia uniflora TaxID=39325 RepID=A0A7J7P609_9MAGN|nr:hypothetical protein GIB67_026374 [Kingdonia uniflora]